MCNRHSRKMHKCIEDLVREVGQSSIVMCKMVDDILEEVAGGRSAGHSRKHETVLCVESDGSIVCKECRLDHTWDVKEIVKELYGRQVNKGLTYSALKEKNFPFSEIF